jgi:hypothetical protein
MAMESIIITPKDQEELKLISAILKKMRIESKVLTEEDKEDIVLGALMSEANRAQKVSREAIMKKLKQ